MKLLRPHQNDFGASLIVFLVALPLCLGISLASEAPLESGIIAGIVGGIIVGAISGSRLGVSGPAAGLAVIVAASIVEAESFEKFLAAGVVAGVFQLIFGLIRLGRIKEFVPNAVITGMLAGIGVLLLYKQIPYVLSPDFSYSDPKFHIPTIAMGIVSIILLAKHGFWKKIPLIGKLPIHLPLAILCGLIVVQLPGNIGAGEIKLPILPDGNVLAWIKFPDFSALAEYTTYLIGLKIAIVASLESLLSLEATDKLSGGKPSPANRELLAQGAGNLVSSLIGGLPVTQVIVRSTANQSAGAQTKYSAVFHGIIMLVVMMAFPFLAAALPLPFLAAILVLTGFKLASPKVWKQQFAFGFKYFLAFVITISGVVFIDLLNGVILGMVYSIFVLGFKSFKKAFHVEKAGDTEVLIPIGDFNIIHQISLTRKNKENLTLKVKPKDADRFSDWFEKEEIKVTTEA